MSILKKARGAIIWALLALLIAAIPSRAQDPTPPPKEEPPKSAGTTTPLGAATTDDQPDVPPTLQTGPVNPYGGDIKAAGTGLPFLGTSTTPLRWGDFSIGKFEYIGIHDIFAPTGQPQQTTTDLSIFRTSLVFDKLFLKNRIVLQYLPQAAIFDGQFHANAAANNVVSFGTRFVLTSRMFLTVQDAFDQVHDNQLIPEHYLAADAQGGALVQNNFLDTNGSFLSNTVSGLLEYDLSPRTIITVSPMYRYAKTTNNQANYLANGQTYQIVATIGYALTPHRSIGLVENYQLLEETTTTVPTNAHFDTTGFFYSEQLAPGLWVTGNAGVEHQTYSDQPKANPLGFAAGFSLVDSISRRVGLALAYTRGLTFDNYITNRLSDRVDGSIGLHLTSRFVLNNSVGYYREIGEEPHTIGKYGTTGFDYRIAGNFSAFTTFAYSYQISSTPALLSGVRKTVAFGIKWQPPTVPAR